MALQVEGTGGKYAPSLERKDGVQRPVKAPFLAQIDFSWSRYCNGIVT